VRRTPPSGTRVWRPHASLTRGAKGRSQTQRLTRPVSSTWSPCRLSCPSDPIASTRTTSTIGCFLSRPTAHFAPRCLPKRAPSGAARKGDVGTAGITSSQVVTPAPNAWSLAYSPVRRADRPENSDVVAYKGLYDVQEIGRSDLRTGIWIGDASGVRRFVMLLTRV
jgi:hypothetical protein